MICWALSTKCKMQSLILLGLNGCEAFLFFPCYITTEYSNLTMFYILSQRQLLHAYLKFDNEQIVTQFVTQLLYQSYMLQTCINKQTVVTTELQTPYII